MRLDKAISRAIKLILIVYGFYAVLDIGIGCLSFDSCREDMLVHHLTAFGAVFGIIAGGMAILYFSSHFLLIFTEYREVRIGVSLVATVVIWFFWHELDEYSWWRALAVFITAVTLVESIFYPILEYIKDIALLRIGFLIISIGSVYYFWGNILELQLLAIPFLLITFVIIGYMAGLSKPTTSNYSHSYRSDSSSSGRGKYPGEDYAHELEANRAAHDFVTEQARQQEAIDSRIESIREPPQ